PEVVDGAIEEIRARKAAVLDVYNDLTCVVDSGRCRISSRRVYMTHRALVREGVPLTIQIRGKGRVADNNADVVNPHAAARVAQRDNGRGRPTAEQESMWCAHISFGDVLEADYLPRVVDSAYVH